MHGTDEDPRCPECGEPIGQRATYCMHCSTDLTEERAAADVDGDGTWDEEGTSEESTRPDTATELGATLVSLRESIAKALNLGREERSTPADRSMPDDQVLDPDGLVDNTLTVVVGIAGGLVVGLFLTIELLAMTGSSLSVLLGVTAWLGATAYLVRRRTVQGAVAASGYGIAIVFLLIPLVAFSPVATVQGGLAERGSLFLVLGFFVVVPVLVAAGIGYVASRYAPSTGR